MKAKALSIVVLLASTGSLIAAEPSRPTNSSTDNSIFRLLPNHTVEEDAENWRLQWETVHKQRIEYAALLARPEVMRELTLSDVQKRQVTSIFAEHAKAVMQLTADPQTVAGEAFLARLDELSRRRDAKLLGVLSDAQRLEFDAVVIRRQPARDLTIPIPHVPQRRLAEIARIA